MTEIAVYIEGGGNSHEQKAELRRGFDALFSAEKSCACEQHLSLSFICCGGRQEAYEAFQNELKVNPERISALLVDSESAIDPVPEDELSDAVTRVAHLRQKQGNGARGQGDGWTLSDNLAERVHLMVQCMEAWIVADPEALEEFYKPNFKKDKLPKRPNLEEEPKGDLFAKLEKATEGTQKGKYGKIKHASKLLGKIDPDAIAGRCARFGIFRQWLTETVEGHTDNVKRKRRQ